MDAIFVKLLNMSVAAGWLILAVILLRQLFRRIPAYIRLILWSLVGLRMICPFTFESVLSLIPSAETFSPDLLDTTRPVIRSGVSFLNTTINPLIASSLVPAADAGIPPLQAITGIAAMIWLIGMAVLVIASLIGYLRLRRKLAFAVISRENIWLSDQVASPFVLGLIKPRIYVPFGLDDAEMGHVLAHEKMHIRRRDHWLKPAVFLLLMVNWFNPLVWAAYILFCRDIELACDERVVKDLDITGRMAYSHTLLTCSVGRKAIAVCPVAFGEIGVRQRISRILNHRRPAFLAVLIAILVCAAVAVCFLTNPRTEKELPPIASGLYVFETCIYMHPFSSYLPFEDTGCVYQLGEEHFAIIDKKTGEILVQNEKITWNWQPFSDQAWLDLFQIKAAVTALDSYPDSYRAVQLLTDQYRLLNMGGHLWLMQLKNGFAWSIYSLVSGGSDLTIPTMGNSLQWYFHPMISAFFPAMTIRLDAEADEILVTASDGTLYLHDQTQKPNYIDCGQAHRYSASQHVMWAPWVQGSAEYYAANSTLYLEIRSAGRVVHEAILTVIKSGTDAQTGATIYEITLRQREDGSQIQYDPSVMNGFVLIF